MRTDRNQSRPSFWETPRRFVRHYLVSLMVFSQLVSLLMVCGVDLSPRILPALILLFVPVTAATLLTRREARLGVRAATRLPGTWMLTALALLGLWSGSYFLAGLLIDASRARFLPLGPEAYVPLMTDFALIYLLVFPLFLLPFFALESDTALRRLTLGNVILIGACTLCFLAFPVAFERPPLPPPPHDLGGWILSLVHGSDPAWNCLPSEHCAMASLAALALFAADRKRGLWAIATALLIGFSTLCTKQHYLVDALAGFGLSGLIHLGVRWKALALPQQPSAPEVSAVKPEKKPSPSEFD